MIMKKIKILFVCCGIFLLPVSMIGQIKSLRVSLRTDSTSRIDEKAQQNIEKLITQSEQIISAYNDKATMFDLDKGKVSPESIDSFKRLFHGGAYIFNDLVLYGRRIPMNEYTAFVADHLRGEGVNFKISNLLLKSAVKNPASDNQYEIVVKVIKLLTRVYDRNKKKFIEYPKYKQANLEFIITVQGEDLDQTQIYGIDGQIEDPPPPRAKELQFFGAYSYGMADFKIDEKFASNALKFSSKRGYDIGMKFAWGISRNKKSKIVAGISYGNINYSLISDSSIVKNEGLTKNKDISVSTIRVMETVKSNNLEFSYLQARLGAQIYLTKGFKQVEWGLDFEVLPTYVLSGGQNSSGLVKDYTTYGHKTNELFCFNGSSEIDESISESGSFLFGAEVKTFLLYYLGGRKSAISAGLAYRRYFNNWLTSPLILSEFLPHNLAMELSFIKKLN